MNKHQTEVEKQLLENEKKVLEDLKKNYTKALKDVKSRIKDLEANELTQSKIYQLQYQQNLGKQLQSIIDLLSADNVQTINDYLAQTYNDGFIGTLYNMQNEGVPFIMPIDQEAVIKSISKKTEDFQLSKTLYENAEKLKNTIKSEITRGISKGAGYAIISRNISNNSEADLKKAYRIARTEGGRVQSEAKFEAMKRAKDNGADVVKQWDSTLDNRTRMSHAMLDGQIKELDEEFEVNGNKAMYPHGFGIAEEDINCRCSVLERARWAVEDEKDFTKVVDGDIMEFKNVKDYQDYKEKYFDFYKNKAENEVKEVVNYKDITDEVLGQGKKKYKLVKQKFYIDDDGRRYDVDGKNVILKPSIREREVAIILGKTYGGRIRIIPRVNDPKNIKTPDYMIGMEKYDLKEVNGNGKSTLDNAVKEQKRQASNFIFDISKSEMNEQEAINQIKKIYASKHRSWIKQIILIKKNNILGIYDRK